MFRNIHPCIEDKFFTLAHCQHHCPRVLPLRNLRPRVSGAVCGLVICPHSLEPCFRDSPHGSFLCVLTLSFMVSPRQLVFISARRRSEKRSALCRAGGNVSRGEESPWTSRLHLSRRKRGAWIFPFCLLYCLTLEFHTHIPFTLVSLYTSGHGGFPFELQTGVHRFPKIAFITGGSP